MTEYINLELLGNVKEDDTKGNIGMLPLILQPPPPLLPTRK